MFECQYKRYLSGYWEWKDTAEGLHAERWRVFPLNIGPHLSINETSFSRGKLYTIVTNKEANGKMVLGTDSDIVLHAQRQIRSYLRNKVTEITLDLSEGMHRICQLAFPKASRVIDRFHVQRLVLDVVQEIRIKHRFETQSMPIPMPGRTQNLRAENMSLSVLKTAKRSRNCRPTVATLCLNLLISEPPHSAREQTCFSDSSPDLKETYWLSQNLRAIFNKRSIKSAARLNLARWYNRVAGLGFKSFNTIIATVYRHADGILNYFDNRSTNASA